MGKNTNLIILAIDTSCDETSAAVVQGTTVLSNVLWSQAMLHSKFGGVYPSLAKRAHEEHIDYIINKALTSAFPKSTIVNLTSLITKYIDAIAVTVGPGLAIALEVGIKKAKELCNNYKKPLIIINHVEGHILSVLAKPNKIKPKNTGFFKETNSVKTSNALPSFPCLSLVASGKHTDLILVNAIGNYKTIAHSIDDALGEALDKAARMLGLGYPGGEILEKFAKHGNKNTYNLPLPMIGRENKFEFSYSGLKTAMWKLVDQEKPLTKTKIENLAADFQDRAFQHVERITNKVLTKHKANEFWLGGGVSANTELRKRLRKLCKTKGIVMRIPYSKKLCTDNAAMIGVAACFKVERKGFVKNIAKVERVPRYAI